jgi:chromate transporter
MRHGETDEMPIQPHRSMNPDQTDIAPRPKSLLDVYLSFTLLAMQGFGGALAVAQRELVDKKRWLTNEEFAEEWGVAQILPGPNVVNLAVMLGGRYFGGRGALAALAGMISIPLVVLLLIAIMYAQFATHPGATGALRGMGAVAAGMIAAAGMRLLPAIKKHPLGVLPCVVFGALAFAGVALLRLPLIFVLLGLGMVCCGLTYRRMGLQ